MSFVRPVEILEPNLTENRSSLFEEVTGSALPETESRTKSLKRGAKLRLNETTYYSTVRNLEVPTPKADSDQAKLLDIMIKYGNNPDGIPALLYAAKKGDQEAVKLLLAHGADIQTKDFFGSSILKYALLSKDKDLVRFVLDQGVDVNSRPKQEFEVLLKDYDCQANMDAGYVIGTDDPELFDLLVERGWKYDYMEYSFGYGEESLVSICVIENSDILLRYLIQKGYKINPKSIWSCFSYYGYYKNISCENRLENFKYLLKIGILDPANSSLNLADYLCRMPISFFRILIDQKYKLDCLKYDGKGILHMLAQTPGFPDSIEKTHLIIQNGIDVDARDSGNNSPIVYAIFNKNKEIVKILLENGADPNQKAYNRTPLIQFSQDPEIKKLLREFGAKD
jgi:ankyrin repeat protein